MSKHTLQLSVRIAVNTFICLVLLFFASPCLAIDFAFDYNVVYEVQESGLTDVIQNISITNLKSNYYALNYAQTINTEKIASIWATDETGKLSITYEQYDGQTIINVPFERKVVGINNRLDFSLHYVSQDIAQQNGRIWEIIIPGITNQEDIRSYNVSLKVPDSFGETAYLSPSPGNDNVWSLNELKGKGISAAFGEVQVYTFNLVYHLQNEQKSHVLEEITLPPDTAYQKVILERLSVIPENVVLDRDNNWLAQYLLQPQEQKNITAEGSILVYVHPQSGHHVLLDESDMEIYTQSIGHWETTSDMVNTAEDLQTPLAIYDYVVDKLTYNYDRIEPGLQRLGAIAAFENPDQAVCMEFSDLFIALARAANIPAREIHGYAHTNNERLQPLSLLGDVLHTWVEYYDLDQQLWIPIDPTWGNTTYGVDYFSKLDFNHISFAILGEKSNYPYPAGSFRSEEAKKDVYIDFSTQIPEIIDPTVKTEMLDKSIFYSGDSQEITLKLSNQGNTMYEISEFGIDSDLVVNHQINVPQKIPPYGHILVNAAVDSKPELFMNSYNFQVRINDQSSEFSLQTNPFYFKWQIFVPAGIVILVFVWIVKNIWQKKHS